MDYFRPVIFCISVCGIFFCSLSAIIQVDLKKLIAYSSVAHMNLVALGLFSLNTQGIQGAIFLMIAHGLVSSGLFFLVGFLYTRYGTRNIERYCGLVQVMPLYTVFFFIFMLANVGFPITCNFVGELLVLIGVAQKSYAVALIASFSGVFCVAYSFIAFNRIAFLNLKSDREDYKDLSRVEFTILFSLASLIIVLGIKPGIVLSITDSFINNFFRSI